MYEPRVHQHHIAGLAHYLLKECHALTICTAAAMVTRGWDEYVAAFDAPDHFLHAPGVELLVH